MKYAVFVAVLAFIGTLLPAHAGQGVVAGDGLTLTEAARIKFNRDTRPGDRQVAVEHVAPSGDYTRLAASFGMDAEEARGMSLEEVFVAKVNHGKGVSERQLVKDGAMSIATRSPVDVAGRAQLAASAGLDPAEAAGMTLGEIAAVKFARGPAND